MTCFISISPFGSLTFYVDVVIPLSLPRLLPDLTVYMSYMMGVTADLTLYMSYMMGVL
jgi:hypothetical protein